jgi:lysozyme
VNIPQDTLDGVTTRLKLEELYRRYPYPDSLGFLTVGYGRNLVGHGVSEKESCYLLANDIKEAWGQLQAALPWIAKLDPVRQAILVDMTVNMGIKSTLGFKNTLACVKIGDYTKASKNMLVSKWASQVGERATKLSQAMLSGKWW